MDDTRTEKQIYTDGRTEYTEYIVPSLNYMIPAFFRRGLFSPQGHGGPQIWKQNYVFAVIFEENPNKRCCCFRTRNCIVSEQENLLFPNKRCCCFRTKDLVVPKQENLLFPNKRCCCSRTSDFVVSKQENVWIPTKTIFLIVFGVKKSNVGGHLKRVLAKFEAKRSHPQGVNGQSKISKTSQNFKCLFR